MAKSFGPRKLRHKTAVATLRDVITEANHNAESGDIRLATQGRQTALLATILLQVISSADEKQFNDIALANYKAKEVEEEAEEEANSDDDNK